MLPSDLIPKQCPGLIIESEIVVLMNPHCADLRYNPAIGIIVRYWTYSVLMSPDEEAGSKIPGRYSDRILHSHSRGISAQAIAAAPLFADLKRDNQIWAKSFSVVD